MLSLPFALNELHVTMCKAQTKIKPTPLCKMQEDAGPALYQPMTLQEQGLLLLYSDIYLPQPPDLQWRCRSSPLQRLPKCAQIPMQDLRVLPHTHSWARILPPSLGHSPEKNSPGRALEADFPEQQGAPDTIYSASQPEQQELSCLSHGIRQIRMPSMHGVPMGRELDTNACCHNTCFFFGTQQKNTGKGLPVRKM